MRQRDGERQCVCSVQPLPIQCQHSLCCVALCVHRSARRPTALQHFGLGHLPPGHLRPRVWAVPSGSPRSTSRLLAANHAPCAHTVCPGARLRTPQQHAARRPGDLGAARGRCGHGRDGHGRHLSCRAGVAQGCAGGIAAQAAWGLHGMRSRRCPLHSRMFRKAWCISICISICMSTCGAPGDWGLGLGVSFVCCVTTRFGSGVAGPGCLTHGACHVMCMCVGTDYPVRCWAITPVQHIVCAVPCWLLQQGQQREVGSRRA